MSIKRRDVTNKIVWSRALFNLGIQGRGLYRLKPADERVFFKWAGPVKEKYVFKRAGLYKKEDE